MKFHKKPAKSVEVEMEIKCEGLDSEDQESFNNTPEILDGPSREHLLSYCSLKYTSQDEPVTEEDIGGARALPDLPNGNHTACEDQLLNNSHTDDLIIGGGDGASTKRVEIGPTVCVSTDAPDGGWGWMVVLASFLIHMIADGVTYSFGVLTPHYIQYYGISRETVGWLASIMVGLTYATGPIASLLSDRFGFRSVTIAGAIFSGFGFGGMYFCSELWFLFTTCGVFCGIGFGLMYLPAIVTVGIYFEKKRSLAIGLAVCGSGIGTFVFSPLIEYLVEEYYLQGCMLIAGGIIFNCIPCGMVFLPLAMTTKKRRSEKHYHPSSSSDKKKKSGSNQKRSDEDQMVREYLNNSLKSVGPSDNNIHVGQALGPNARSRSISMSTKGRTDILFAFEASHCGGGGLPMVCDKIDGAPGPPTDCIISSMPDIRSHHLVSSPLTVPNRGTTLSHPHLLVSSMLSVLSSSTNIHHASTVGGGVLPSEGGPPESIINRSTSKRQSSRRARWSKICHDVGTLFDFGLFTDPIFLMLAMSNFFTSLGFNAPYLYVKDRAGQAGIDSQWASFLISVIGIGNTVGRIVFGAMSSHKCVDTLMLYSVSLVLCGVCTILSSLCVTYTLMVLYAAAFGLLTGVYVTLTSVVLVELLGVEKLNNSFGLILLFQGIAVFMGPPMAGWVYDRTGSYDAAFWLCGGMIGFSGLMLFPVPCLRKFLASRGNRPATEKFQVWSSPGGKYET